MSVVQSIIAMISRARDEDARLVAGIPVGEPPFTTRSVVDMIQSEGIKSLSEAVKHVEHRIQANRRQIEESTQKPMWWGNSKSYIGESYNGGRGSGIGAQTKRGRR